jgi:hypothetical protein
VCEASEPGLVPEATTRIANHVKELHTLWSAHTEKTQAVAQNLPGGIVEPQSGVVDGLEGRITLRGDPATVIPAVINPSDFLDIPGNAVRFAQLGGLANNPGEITE